MEFGLQFFPAVGPAQKSGAQYWREALSLTRRGEGLGFTSVRTVEHYFHDYGGYSPSPLIFLSAAAALTTTMRMITGAVLPVFNHPLKMASEIAMVDSISEGRLEVGFARAFLPQEFERFGVSMDESRSRFDEGVAQILELLAHENVTSNGQHHAYQNVTVFPRPVQTPHPPVWIAAMSTPESFESAGRLGYNMMVIPLAGPQMAPLLEIYRKAWTDSGRPGCGRIMFAFHMFCDHDREKARALAVPHLDRYLRSIVDAASDWSSGISSKDYPNYGRIIEGLAKETAASQIEKGGAWIGTPDDIVAAARKYRAAAGHFDIASLQVNFGNIAIADAEKSVDLFASHVMPQLA